MSPMNHRSIISWEKYLRNCFLSSLSSIEYHETYLPKMMQYTDTLNQIEKKMARHAEDLPVEFWIEIFDYLTINDIFQSFSQLNKSFHDILTSTHLLFKLDLKAETNDRIEHLSSLHTSNMILNRVIALKSFSYEFFPEFFQNHGEKFIRLRSLVIKANSREIPSVCLALQKLNRLEYLSLSCIPNQNLLEQILTSRSLRQCRLHFWRLINPIHNHHLDTDSDIEVLYLRLNDDTNHSVMNLLLSHMPKLKKLEISEENFLKKKSHPLFHQTFSNLEILRLAWGYSAIQSDCLQYLSTTMPNLKHVSLSIFYKTLAKNLIDHLWMLLKDMKQMKISILCRRLTKTVDKNIETNLNDYCQQIQLAIHSRSTASLDIHWFEINPHTHKIQINFLHI